MYLSVKFPERIRAEEAAKAAAAEEEARARAAAEATRTEPDTTTEEVSEAPSTQAERPLQVVASTFKIVERNTYWWKVAYKVDVSNASSEDINLNVKVNFMDGAGFPVSEDYVFNKSFASKRTTSVIGIQLLKPDVARKIKSVEIGS